MLNPKRVLSNTPEQGQLLPTYPSDFVPKDHLARVVNEVVEALDLKTLYAAYGWEGGKVSHPKALLKIVFYAYSQGNRSSRKISQDCRENNIYLYISGGLRPDFRTISEFRKRRFNLIKDFFTQIILLCHQLGMVQIGNINLDGTKVKANAADSNIVEKDKLAKELDKIEKQISELLTDAEEVDRREDEIYGPDNSGQELPQELRDARARQEKLKAILAELNQKSLDKMSLSDPEARFMKSKGRIQMSYNAQCATENQVILAYEVTSDQSDADRLIPVLTQLEELAQSALKKDDYPLQDVKLTTDAGYDSGKNLKHLKARKVDAYISGQKDNLKAKEQHGKIPARPFSKDKFTYHASEDYYECPTGQKLRPVSQTQQAKKTYVRQDIIYRASDCHHCASQKDCVTSKTGLRQLARYPDYDPYREEIDAKLRTEAGKEMLKHRRCDVEPMFGQLKQSVFAGGGFLVRGLKKTGGEFGLACIAHNLRKIATYLKSNTIGVSMVDIAKTRPALA